MSHFATGLTLTAEERKTTSPSTTKGIAAHTCEVRLPDGRSCTVTYRRQGPCSHEFNYGDPVNQRIWFSKRIEPGSAGIEKKAASLAPEAFGKASEAERTQMRRSLTPAEARAHPSEQGPEMDAKAAALCAGRYAPCVSFASGRLLRIGCLYDTPEAAAAEIASGRHRSVRLTNGQQLVVGICSRSERRWTLPKFAAVSPSGPQTDPVAAHPEAAPDPQDDDLADPGPD